MSLSSAPNSPQKSRLEPPRKGRFGGGWTRSLTNLRKEAQQSPSSPSGSIQAPRPGVKSSSSTTAIPQPRTTSTATSTLAPQVTSPTNAPKGLRAFFQSFKRSNSSPAPIRSEKIPSALPLTMPAVRPARLGMREGEVERSSSNGSKERIAHEEDPEKDGVTVVPASILQEKNELEAVLEPVDIHPLVPAEDVKEVVPAEIPLPPSPSLSFDSAPTAVLGIPLAAALPADLTGTEPLVRAPSEESDEIENGVPSLIYTDKEEELEQEAREAEAEGELVTPVTTSESAVPDGGVGIVGVDRIEEEDEDGEQDEVAVIAKGGSSETVDGTESTSMAGQAPVPVPVDETEKAAKATSEPQPQPDPQPRPTITLDTTSPTLGRNGSFMNPGSTSSTAGRGMSSSSSFSSGRTPVSAAGGNGGRSSSYQNQQHHQHQQQQQQQQHQQQQNRPQYQSQHSYQQQQYQQQQQQQRQQHPQQYQGFSPTTPSSTQSLGRSGSRQIRQSGYGLNKLSIPHSTSYSSRTSSRSPSQKRMSVSPTMYTMGGVFVEAEEIGDADEKRLTEAMFCS